MSEESKFKIGEKFKPAPQFKSLYYSYLELILSSFLILAFIPIVLFVGPAAIPILIPVFAIFIVVAFWIPDYYDTVVYRITDSEIIWRRGVWFKKTGTVPYNRITNTDVSQGPIQRMLGIGDLNIQTAGYSGEGGAEISIQGIKQFEELRGLIMDFVRGKKPVAVETYDEENINVKILGELVKIRELLGGKR